MRKPLVFILLFTLYLAQSLQAQNVQLADSIESLYHRGDFDWQKELELLQILAEQHYDMAKKLRFSQELLEMGLALDSFGYAFAGYLQKGNAFRIKGDLNEAIGEYFKAATLAVDKEMDREHGLANVAMADVYSIMGNHHRSITHYRKAIDILRAENDSINVASAFLNAGDEYHNHGKLDSALLFFEKSGEIFEAVEYDLGVAYNKGNIGLVYASKGDFARAESNIVQAVELMETLGDYYPISVYLTYMSDIYMEKGEDSAAVNFAKRSLELATEYGLKAQISEANLKLSELYEEMGAYPLALKYFKDHISYEDSVKNIEAVQQLADQRADFEVAQKQAEVDLLNEQRKNQRLVFAIVSVALLLIAILAFILYRRNRLIRRANARIEEERNRSENLLLNILPAETAHELKQSGKVAAKKFDSVTVLFADFKDFTPFAETSTPEKLVETVDFYFSRFDQIMEKHGMEKIKTIGDAYMAAGGLPFPTDDHAHQMVLAAMDILKFVKEIRETSALGNGGFDIRIGINTGPVVAGVVGIRKFAYDIWGHTVNTAARMESSSAPGRINVSEHTYRLIKDQFIFTPRGEIEVKNRSGLKMYFVEGVKA